MTSSNTTPTADHFAEVYDVMRRIARRILGENRAHTLQSGDLLHEACLRVLAKDDLHLDTPGQLYCYVAKAIRSVFKDYERARDTEKRGSGRKPAQLSVLIYDPADPSFSDSLSLECLEEALDATGEEAATIALMRLSIGAGETATKLGVTDWKVRSAWALFRAELLSLVGE